MRKLICLALLCLGIASARAVPIVTFTVNQDNYFLNIYTSVSDGGQPVNFANLLFVNDREWNFFGYFTILRDPMTEGSILRYGENTSYLIWNGQRIEGPSFTIAVPTGERPLPDTGSTVALLGLALLGIAFGRHCRPAV